MKITLSIADYLIILLYFAVILAVSWHFSRNRKDATEYLLGGRGMHWVPVGVSILMTFFSTYSMVMVPGEIYNNGLDLWILALLSPYIGVVSILIFTKFFFKIQAFTPYEYLAYRYDRYARLLAAAGAAMSSILYVASVLLTTAIILEAAAGWNTYVSIAVIGGISLAYTAYGGIKGVVWTDFIQFFIMVIGMGGLLWALCNAVDGGAVGAVEYAFEHGHGLRRFSEADFYRIGPYIRLTFWLSLINCAFGALGAGLNEMTVQRLMATGSLRSAVRAQLTSAIMTTPLQLLIWFIGLGIFSFYAQNPDPRVTSGDGALFVFVSTNLPPLFPGIFLSGMLACSMSTLSSCFNSSAAVWLREFYLQFICPGADDRKQVVFSRRITVAVGMTGIGFAMLQGVTMRFLGQTMVEVGLIFAIFTVSVGFFNYFFAIASRKASSLSFWVMILYGYGLKVAMLIWYGMSKRGEVLFPESGDPGFAGPLDWRLAIAPLVLVGLFLMIGLWSRDKRWRRGWILGALPVAGFTSGMVLWWLFSHACFKGEPLVLSFQWEGLPGLVTTLLIMLGWQIWGPEQPRERWQGLVWGHSDESAFPLKEAFSSRRSSGGNP